MRADLYRASWWLPIAGNSARAGGPNFDVPAPVSERRFSGGCGLGRKSSVQPWE
ncbi:MAG: hypothetical protein KME26_30665 [Oscillatoria princeps RMCB-10]|jgi:hypothetical protein|nr:hypothetical protein [Oscillatoria princeps RMCB-10]